MTVKTQELKFGPVDYREHGHTYQIVATVRWDDSCGNGHNSFAVTAVRQEVGGEEYSYDCCHEEVAKRFPGLRHIIRWHSFSAKGPMHYVDNVCYHAGNRDCWGLTKGESRPIKNHKTGELSWVLEANKELPRHVVSETQPTETATLSYQPWCRRGVGKERDFSTARSIAVWPEATEEQLSLPKEELEKLLLERLPALMEEFKKDVEELGLVW